MPTIGIIGAGKLGITVAQLALAAGYTVYVSGSGDPAKKELIVRTLAPGAIAARPSEVATLADIVLLAIPLSRYRELPVQQLVGKTIIDATNYWWETDGARSSILPDDMSSSEAIQDLLPQSQVVKALNHMGYHHLHDEARPTGIPGRKAIAVAGGSKGSVAEVSKVVNSLGFDPLYIGDLAKGKLLEPGGPVFGANLSSVKLEQLLVDQ